MRTLLTYILLACQALLAVLAASAHYGLTAEYGDISASATATFLDGFEHGVIGLTLLVVGGAGLLAVAVATRRGRAVASAGAITAAMLLAMFVATGPALQHKLDTQYDATPRCAAESEPTSGPYGRAVRAEQAAMDSVEHVGWFGGGGGSGVGGCDRTLTLTQAADPVAHYRQALPEAGWTIDELDEGRVRATRGGMAFEVWGAGRQWTVWTGPKSAGPRRDGEQVSG